MSLSKEPFLSYHWPANTETQYQLLWRIHQMNPVVGGAIEASTISWDPQVIIRTGTASQEGLPVVMNIQSAQYMTTETGMEESPAITVEAMSVHAVLTPRGHWNVVQWSIPPGNPIFPRLPRSILTAMFPLQDLLPPIPADGWTAGQTVEVPYPERILVIAFFHTEPQNPVDLRVKLEPTVRDHHWTVHSALSLPRDLPVFLVGPSTPDQPDGRYPATMTAHRVTVTELVGRDEGSLVHGLGMWQGTLRSGPGTNRPSSPFTARWDLIKIGS